ncbi:uncharacterized protein MAM_00640 [Metarhizium album ARSEF 1941]|uniref:Uncharacterized protein n=1 Tax=Metarhizium album (strain ARSEF 1941) TaxID=1081103 RepID=A0A0B2X5I1_METAS|nr:uncharacterized protein MAM_00640 [Metarhizium album ARSEF 1941]KHO01639.1 hypothetical protein MAM_00640 [Metarhizium album ARSEF 1941]
MRTTATLSAILAASAFTRAQSIATEPQVTSTAVVLPPLSTGNTISHGNETTGTGTIECSAIPFSNTSTVSAPPVPSTNSSGILPPGTGTGGSGLPPLPTSSTPAGPTAGPTSGATLATTQNSWLAAGIAVFVASLVL